MSTETSTPFLFVAFTLEDKAGVHSQEWVVMFGGESEWANELELYQKNYNKIEVKVKMQMNEVTRWEKVE